MAVTKSCCKAIIQQQASMAIYVHCGSHRLNLAIVSTCKIRAFRNEILTLPNFSDFRPKDSAI